MRRAMPMAFALLLALSALPAAAQDRPGPTAEDLKARRDAKLAEDWLTKAPWILSFEKAKAVAAETGKPIFAYFTRSYQP